MLVLDRKLQEGFWIDGRIFVKVLSIGKRRVKLGIEAPSDLEVVREELAHGQAPPDPGANHVGGESAQGTVRSAGERT
jgi:carbon storage regulator